MDSIEQKALALVNEAFREPYYKDWSQVPQGCLSDALIRAIEQHDAFRQEVSDAVGSYIHDPQSITGPATMQHLRRFIIAKPDPLVDLCYSMGLKVTGHELRAAIEKRGGKIVWGEG